MTPWFKNTSGTTAIEYGLIAAIISVSIMGIVFVLGDELLALFQYAADRIAGAG